MFLAFDIGNTNIVIGLFEMGKLIAKWRLPTLKSKSDDDYAIDLVELFLSQQIDIAKIEGAIIGSVVSKVTDLLENALNKITEGKISEKILVIGKNVEIDIICNVKNKSEVGQDRLINSIGAYKKYGGNLVIVDFGTATTFDIVGQNGEYEGGIIAPGINLSLKALHEMTDKLPKIEVKEQNNIIGKNTIEAMNSGVYYGYISLIEGLLKKIENELGKKMINIFTGGLVEVFANSDLKKVINYHEPDLTLEGLKIIYENR